MTAQEVGAIIGVVVKDIALIGVGLFISFKIYDKHKKKKEQEKIEGEIKHRSL